MNLTDLRKLRNKWAAHSELYYGIDWAMTEIERLQGVDAAKLQECSELKETIVFLAGMVATAARACCDAHPELAEQAEAVLRKFRPADAATGDPVSPGVPEAEAKP
jgi:hypothetical protein